MPKGIYTTSINLEEKKNKKHRIINTISILVLLITLLVLFSIVFSNITDENKASSITGEDKTSSTYKATTTNLRGEKGEQGEQGEQGLPGKDIDMNQVEIMLKYIVNKSKTSYLNELVRLYYNLELMPGISDIGRTFDPRSWVQGTSILDQTFNDKIKPKETKQTFAKQKKN